jgi:predicted permease
MESLLQDFRYGLRTLRVNPGFTAAAALTLAIGIGANTAIFGMIEAFLLRSLPVKEPRQLAIVGHVGNRGHTQHDFPYPVFEQLRDHNHSFSGIFAYDATRASITINGEPDFVDTDFVSGSYFDVLGVSAALGRGLTPDDDRPGQPAVAVLSHSYWKQRFQSDAGVIGANVSIAGFPLRIVGVMPAGFHGRHSAGASAQIILPMSLQPRFGLKDHNTFNIMARLAPGVTLEQARADLEVVFQQALAVDPTRPTEPHHIRLTSGVRGDSGDYDGLGRELRLLMAIIGIGLLIGSINVANLLLARGVSRRNEITIRLAVGASRGRLIRQLLVESSLLALAGGAAGLLLAYWLTGALTFVLSLGREPIVFDFVLNPQLLAFTAALSILTGLLFGTAPALAATRGDLNAVLKSSDSHATSSRNLSAALIVPQVALSIVLLVGAGLLVHGLRNLYSFDPGFERTHVVMAWVMPVLNGYDHAREMALYRDLYENVNTIPGVESAGLARLRLVYGTDHRTVQTRDQRRAPRVYCNQVGPRFFETMRIPLLVGREFSLNDNGAAPRVAVVSHLLARHLFPDASPVGQRVEFAGDAGGPVTIVGVAGDIRHHPDERDPGEAVYIPYAQAPDEELGQMNIVLRTSRPAAVVAELRRRVQALDRDLPLRDVETQEEEIDEYLAGHRSLAVLLSAFGALTLLLTSLGLYGTTSYAVGTRTREFGIRMALGAAGPDLERMILRQALRQVALGMAAGIPAAIVCARLAGSLQFGITAADPVSIAAAAVALSAVALVAAWFAARRATRTDPVAALR